MPETEEVQRRPGREIDTKVAQLIFGFEVYAKNKVLHEKTDKGDRPLRNYSKEMQWAWEVGEKMRISLIPIEGGDFSDCGAAVGENAPEVICKAALVVQEKRSQNVNPQSVLIDENASQVSH